MNGLFLYTIKFICRGVYIHIYIFTIYFLVIEEKETPCLRVMQNVLNVISLTSCQRARTGHIGVSKCILTGHDD